MHLSCIAEGKRLGQIFTTLLLKMLKVIQNNLMFVFSVSEMEENTFAVLNKIVFKLLGENLSKEQMALNHQIAIQKACLSMCRYRHQVD